MYFYLTQEALEAAKSASVLDVISLVISGIAAIISIGSLVVSRRKLINTTITSNRIEWINSVRSLVQQFVVEYRKNDTDLKKNSAVSIKLYLRHDVKIYQPFISQLDACTKNSYDDTECEKLIVATQDMLNDVWNRMKREAGISKRSEARLKERLKNEKLSKEQHHH